MPVRSLRDGHGAFLKIDLDRFCREQEGFLATLAGTEEPVIVIDWYCSNPVCECMEVCLSLHDVPPERSQPPRWAILDAPGAERSERGEALLIVIFLAALAGAAVLGRRNLRLGRSDRKGAARLAMYFLVLSLLVWTFRASHAPDLRFELGLFVPALLRSIAAAVRAWLGYLALEPFVRKTWRETLIAWSRLLGGSAATSDRPRAERGPVAISSVRS